MFEGVLVNLKKKKKKNPAIWFAIKSRGGAVEVKPLLHL
jgi:hypothetical protein